MSSNRPVLGVPTPISALLAIFVTLSALYSIAVPPFEASDELWHYPMVKYIADNWELPVQDPDNVGPWRQEGSQPPLYYFLGAVATAWIDTSDMGVVRNINPHADNGIATPDGNVNLITHHPEAEAFPWQGTILAVHIVRLLSVLMGAVTVYLTYRLALELVPDRPTLAIISAAINAFTPMFLFISGAVNNDNLVIPLCSWALLLMVRILKTTHQKPGPPQPASALLLLGLAVGLALLTKESAGGLVLLTALVVAYVGWQERSARRFAFGAVTTGGPAILIAGWWYVRNWRLYGDPLGQNVFIEILGQRDVPADLAQLWREQVSFFRGYWGNFGGLNVPMSEGVYTLLDLILVLVVAALILRVLWRFRAWVRQRQDGAGLEQSELLSWLLVLLWPALVVLLWVTWATTTWSSQGRLVFSAIAVWSLLLALGWDSLMGLLQSVLNQGLRWMHRLREGESGARRIADEIGPSLRTASLLSLPLLLLVIGLVAPFAWILPAYARPPSLTDAQVAQIPQRIDAVFFHPAGGQLKLLGVDAPAQAVTPGESVPVTLYWEALEPFGQDYSIFLHVVDAHDLVPAQRDAFPGMGTLSTQWLNPGRRWAERRVLTLPETAFSPNQAVFEVGLYDFHTSERLAVVDAEGQISGDNVRFGQLAIESKPGEVPNPISIDFGGQMELIGYDLDRRAVRSPAAAEGRPGEAATLTLYWRAQRRMTSNYSISTQFVNTFGVKAAQKDAWPLDGQAPTSLWEPGIVIKESRDLAILVGTPPGVYDVYVTVYPTDDPDASLVVTPSGGRLQTDHVVLTTMRVLPAQP